MHIQEYTIFLRYNMTKVFRTNVDLYQQQNNDALVLIIENMVI